MDPTVATGAAAIMAVRVLLDHDVPEENIYLVSLIMARQGTGSCVHICLYQRILSTICKPLVCMYVNLQGGDVIYFDFVMQGSKI